MIDQEERLRRDAAMWFARMRGPGANEHRDAFETWQAVGTHREAYQRLVRRFEESAVLGGSRLEGLRLIRSPRTRSGATSGKIIVAMAACVIAAIGLATFRFAQDNGGIVGPSKRFSTTVGEIRAVALADGVTLILDTDSAATTSDLGGQRVVRLDRGRARLAAANGRSLLVQAGDTLVRGQGATLDLAVMADRQVDVTVLSGQAELAARQRTPLTKVAYRPVEPGRQLRLGAGARVQATQPASPAEATWPSGLRAFHKTPLATVAAAANRYDRRQIRFADPEIGRLELTGVFRVTETQRLAKALAAAFGLTVKPTPGGDLVLTRQPA